LENPLTDDGLIYVAQNIRHVLNTPDLSSAWLEQVGNWRAFYQYQLPNLVWPWPEKGEHHYADCIYKEDLPEECIDACSGPGRKDLPVKLWRYALGFIVDVDRARGTLTRYGIEDAGTMSAGTLAEYILWLACGDFAEYEGEDSACGSDFFGLGE
jgi:hypothetical protein